MFNHPFKNGNLPISLFCQALRSGRQALIKPQIPTLRQDQIDGPSGTGYSFEPSTMQNSLVFRVDRRASRCFDGRSYPQAERENGINVK
jgi:hypothetical protein